MLRSTVTRPACVGVRHPSGAHDQIFITFRQLLVYLCETPTETRGLNCRLQLLWPSPVILRSEPPLTHDRILLFHILDSSSLQDKFPLFIPLMDMRTLTVYSFTCNSSICVCTIHTRLVRRRIADQTLTHVIHITTPMSPTFAFS
jgi:hypothetical protein